MFLKKVENKVQMLKNTYFNLKKIQTPNLSFYRVLEFGISIL